MLIDQDRVAVGIVDAEMGAACAGFVHLLIERDAFGFQLFLNIADIFEGVDILSLLHPIRD